MTTATVFSTAQQTPSLVTGVATIDNGETATLAIPMHGRALARLLFPSAFTGTTVTFTVQPYAGASFGTLYDRAGNAVTYAVGASRAINVLELAGAYAFTIVSSGAEAAARSIAVQCVGLNPTVPASRDITIAGGTTTATQGTTPWQTADAPQTTSTYANTQYGYTTGAVTKANIKASAGNVFKLHFTNTNAAVRYGQLFNKATAPAAADTALMDFIIPGGTAAVPGYVEYTVPFGAQFGTGIGWAVSTTAVTFTDAATASEHTVHVEYK